MDHRRTVPQRNKASELRKTRSSEPCAVTRASSTRPGRRPKGQLQCSSASVQDEAHPSTSTSSLSASTTTLVFLERCTQWSSNELKAEPPSGLNSTRCPTVSEAARFMTEMEPSDQPFIDAVASSKPALFGFASTSSALNPAEPSDARARIMQELTKLGPTSTTVVCGGGWLFAATAAAAAAAHASTSSTKNGGQLRSRERCARKLSEVMSRPAAN
mmetsp:Transcript_107377/g.346762  ORF Transcript_107377/g.346762 Transcript_107377/m.346762 type:complete len:216 (+) Transcript_107377:172-819(+)